MEQSTLNITVIWRGKRFILELSSGATLKEFGNELQKLTDVKADTMRLIVPQSSSESSKLLSPFSDEHSHLSLLETSIPKGKSIRMMGVPEVEVDEVQQNAKANLRIAGFDEEERRLKQRMQERRHHASLKLPQGTYIFCDFRTLEIPGIELNPPASEALKRMHMLAADPGIVAIMNKYHWHVGIMTEMAPIGYVGVSPKCILGFNKNRGEEISLRLRTDDLKGFRKYESIKKTLLHELAHMIYSEHDADFYAFDKKLNEEAAALDWTKSKSHTLGGIKHSEHHEKEMYFEEPSNFSHKLGGSLSDQLASARASSVIAAYSRLVNNNSGVAEVHDEPDPDDSGFDMLENSGPTNSLWKEKVVVESPNISQSKSFLEPDPDACSHEEPDPDDNSFKCDQFDGGHVQVMNPLDREAIHEPDPDDSAAENNNLGMGDPPVSETMEEDQTQVNRTFVEPDLDDSSAYSRLVNNNSGVAVVHDVPDPDDSGFNVLENSGPTNSLRKAKVVVESPDMPQSKSFLEPDPDACSHEEPDPDDNAFKCDQPDSGHMRVTNTLDRESIHEPDPDDSEAENKHLGMGDPPASETMEEDQAQVNRTCAEPDPDDSSVNTSMPSSGLTALVVDEPDPDDAEFRIIQDPVNIVCNRLQGAIRMLQSEATSMEMNSVLQTLFKIIRNLVEHPEETKYKRLRMENPVFQRNVANYKAAMEVLSLIGFIEDAVLDEIGKVETYLVLKRNDPGLLWLVKSSLETCISHH